MNALSFNKAESLNHIFLQNNNLKMINDHVFIHCKSLKILDVSNNEIASIQKFAFKNLVHLEELNLSQNKLKLIDELFVSLVAVKWIWLNNNQIEHISASVFTAANVNLQGIYLNRNSISAISPHAFEAVENLKFLFMHVNNCINVDFKNHIIHDNISIKYEMLKCQKEYERIFPEENSSMQNNLAFEISKKNLENCMSFLDDKLEEWNSANQSLAIRLAQQT